MSEHSNYYSSTSAVTEVTGVIKPLAPTLQGATIVMEIGPQFHCHPVPLAIPSLGMTVTPELFRDPGVLTRALTNSFVKEVSLDTLRYPVDGALEHCTYKPTRAQLPP